MKIDKDLEELLRYSKERFDPKYPDTKGYKRWDIDDDGFISFNGKDARDYFALDVEKEKGTRKKVDTSWSERFCYKLLGKKAKKRKLKDLQKKYLADKDIHTYVASERIIDVSGSLERISEDIKDLKDRLNKKEVKKKRKKKKDTYGEEERHWKENGRRIIFSLDDLQTEEERKDETSYRIKRYFSGTETEMIEGPSLLGVKLDLKDYEKVLYKIKSGRFRLKDLDTLNWNNIRYIESEQFCFIPENYMSDKSISLEILWNLKKIETDKAQLMTKGKGVEVGIIDTGVDYNHQEIRDRFKRENLGYDFVDNNKDPMDKHYHGTHVAGTVAGKKTGVAPEVTLYGLRVLNEQGYGSSYNILRALDWAKKNNLDIVNLSLGSNYATRAEQEMYLSLKDKGIIAVAAAGNDGKRKKSYPGSYEGVVCVPATDSQDKRAWFSNINDANDIAAPGVSIYSCTPDGYSRLNGTSMATPHIAGAFSLGISFKNENKDIEKIMKENAKDLGSWEEFGAGLAMAAKTLEALR